LLPGRLRLAAGNARADELRIPRLARIAIICGRYTQQAYRLPAHGAILLEAFIVACRRRRARGGKGHDPFQSSFPCGDYRWDLPQDVGDAQQRFELSADVTQVRAATRGNPYVLVVYQDPVRLDQVVDRIRLRPSH
jgi:hypothetical protein